MLSLTQASLQQRTAYAGVLVALAFGLLPSCTRPDEVDERGQIESNASTGSCGVERWSVKTGTDSAASSVNMTPQSTTIGALAALPVPAGLNQNAGRLQPNEFQTYKLTNVTLTQYKLENDSDYHLVLTEGSNTMIVEIPYPGCVGSGSPWSSQISAARSAFDTRFPGVSTSFQTANIPVTVTGVGFFDLLHGQTGVAPNGFELHSVLTICFGTNCGGTASPDFSLSSSPSSVTAAQGASATSTISATPSNGFSGTIALSVSGVPAGATAGLSATSISGSGSSTLTLNAGTATAGTYTVTVTGTSGSLSHSAAVSFTVTGGGGGGGSGITNGGFETGSLSGWTAAGTASAVTGGHGGTYAARVGSTAATNGDSSIAQTFTAPTGATGLAFYYKVVCPDTVTYDWASATLKDNTAGSTATVLANTCTNSGAWVQATASLTAGHSYTLTLLNHDDNYSGDPTYTLYDDVTITTSGGGGGGGITNGGFETGSFSGWTQSGAASTITTISHSGTYAAFVGSSSATNGDSSIAQTFTVPTGKSQLSIWYANKCPDTLTYDWATITLRDNTTATTTTVLPKTCAASSVWTNVTSSVTAGHSYTLTLTNHDDNSSADPTNTLFDDIVLN